MATSPQSTTTTLPRVASAPQAQAALVTEVPVLQTRYRDYMGRVFFGEMTLYENRLELRGWSWRGRMERVWSLREIRAVEWLRKPEANLVFRLYDGSRYYVKAKGVGVWWHVLDAYIENDGS